VVREALEHAPPEISADLIETGIVLTGGSALLRNLDQFISRNCGLPVRTAPDPFSCVILGLGYQLNHLRRSEWRRFRANGAAANQAAFYDAFGVKEGDRMYLAPDRRVTIW